MSEDDPGSAEGGGGDNGAATGSNGSNTTGSRSTDEEADVTDAVLDFLGCYITKSLRMKYDKWQKLLHADDSKVCGQFRRMKWVF